MAKLAHASRHSSLTCPTRSASAKWRSWASPRTSSGSTTRGSTAAALVAGEEGLRPDRGAEREATGSPRRTSSSTIPTAGSSPLSSTRRTGPRLLDSIEEMIGLAKKIGCTSFISGSGNKVPGL